MIRTLAAVVAGLLVASTAATAQTAVSVRPVANPGRTIRVTTTQDLTITALGMPGGGRLEMTSTGTLTFTQANRALSEQGQMDAEISIENFDMDRLMNGKPEDAKADSSSLVGRSLIAVFDRTGRLVDVKIPKDMQTTSASVRQLLGGAYGLLNGLPDAPMSVGDTKELDVSALPLRLPGADAGSLKARATISLRAIDRVNGDRIAHLDQQVESGQQAAQFTVKGTGTIDVNIDKGFVTASTMHWNFAGVIPGSAATGPGPAPQMQATFKMTLSASE